jgi:hypothetical protein
MNWLILQRCMRLSASGVYEHFAVYVARYPAAKLAGRLLYLEHRSLQQLLVADRRVARQAWRLEHSPPVNKQAAVNPAFISIRDVAVLADQRFSGLLQLFGAATLPPSRRGSTTCPPGASWWQKRRPRSRCCARSCPLSCGRVQTKGGAGAGCNSFCCHLIKSFGRRFAIFFTVPLHTNCLACVVPEHVYREVSYFLAIN